MRHLPIQLKKEVIHPADIDDDLFMYQESTGRPPINFEQVTFFDEDTELAVVSVNRRFGAINRKGEAIVPLIYDKAMMFSEGLSAVKKNNKWGYVDRRHQLIIPFMYDNLIDYRSSEDDFYYNGDSIMGTAGCVRDDKIIVAKNGKQGIINLKNETVVPFSDDEIKVYNQHYIVLQNTEGKQGIINWNRKQIVPFNFILLHLTTTPEYIGFAKEIDIRPDNEQNCDGFWLDYRFKKRLVFGVMTAEQQIVVPAISDFLINNVSAGKALCYDAVLDEHFVYDIAAARRIYAPDDETGYQDENDKINYLRNLMGMSAI